LVAPISLRERWGKRRADWVTDGRRQLATNEERTRFGVATTYGGICAGCGRTLGAEEAVYIESIMLTLKPLTAVGAGWSRKAVVRSAALGRECASPAFLDRTAQEEAERCAGCGRPVHYDGERAGRVRVVCSRRCSSRASKIVRGAAP
jgi:hypothetical protein